MHIAHTHNNARLFVGFFFCFIIQNRVGFFRNRLMHWSLAQRSSFCTSYLFLCAVYIQWDQPHDKVNKRKESHLHKYCARSSRHFASALVIVNEWNGMIQLEKQQRQRYNRENATENSAHKFTMETDFLSLCRTLSFRTFFRLNRVCRSIWCKHIHTEVWKNSFRRFLKCRKIVPLPLFWSLCTLCRVVFFCSLISFFFSTIFLDKKPRAATQLDWRTNKNYEQKLRRQRNGSENEHEY